MLKGTQVVADSDQPDRRAWAPSLGSPRVAGGQSPGPADWPAPRTALGPQTGWQRQRRKAVSDRKHSTGRRGEARAHGRPRKQGPLTGSSTSLPDTLAHAPTPPTSLVPPQAPARSPWGSASCTTSTRDLTTHPRSPGGAPGWAGQSGPLDRLGLPRCPVRTSAHVTTAHQPAPGSEDRTEPATLPRSPILTVGPQHPNPAPATRGYHAGVWAQLRNGPDRHSPEKGTWRPTRTGDPAHCGGLSPRAACRRRPAPPHRARGTRGPPSK